jgi:hypothetical protein
MDIHQKQAVSEVVLDKAGTLETILSNKTDIQSSCLKVSGPMNDDDIAYIGKLIRKTAEVTCLDIKESTELTSIDHNAFENCENLVSVILPNGLKRIGDHAFDNCTGLISMELPDGVQIIGDRAYSGCANLVSINIPKSVSYVGIGTFFGCYKLTELHVADGNARYISYSGILFDRVDKTLLKYLPTKKIESDFHTPNGVVHIGNYAFDGCKGLVSVFVNEGCTDLGERSFVGCEDLKSIILPSTLNNITYNAFEGCGSMIEIEVNASNQKYSSLDGVLYSKKMDTVEIFPKAKPSPYFFPSKVRKIHDGAFAGCTDIHTIFIPPYMVHIHNNAFNGCSALSYVNISSSVKLIGGFAFAGCINLKKIEVCSDNPPKCGVSSFASVDMSKCVLQVPIDSEMSYRKEYGWDSFKNVKESFCLSLFSSVPFLRMIWMILKKVFVKNS